MEADFRIEFVIKPETVRQGLVLTGDVSLHHSTPHYIVSGIRIAGKERDNNPLLPDIDIMCINVEGRLTWVHVDSGMETVLSSAVGQAIEGIVKDEVQVATEDQNDDNE
jgi:hypothetical protein